MASNSVQYKLFNAKLTTVISVSMVLFLLGVVSMVLFTGKNLSDYVRENFIFKLTLTDNTSAKQIDSLRTAIEAKSYVKSVKFVSHDEAVEELKKQIGEDPMEFLDVNPLPDCFDVNLKADQTDLDNLKRIESELKSYKEIAQIDYPKKVLDDVTGKLSVLTVVFLFVAALLMLISFALINNTIRLLVYANRFLIHTMRQVGATRNFIRKPYLIQGLKIGLLSSVLASVAMGLMFFFFKDLSLFVDVQNEWLYVVVFGTIFASGILITVLSSLLAVNKYLKLRVDTLYLI